jgi:peptidyl-tRNA hydrolase
MENHEKPEAIAVRANQEDPIVMYLVVRETLGMGVGKIAAQCAHASQMLLLKYVRHLYEDPYQMMKSAPDWNVKEGGDMWYVDFCEWLNSSFRKVVLKADDKEWAKLKELPNHIIVVDAGLTEIASGSETVLGFFPMKKSQVPKAIKKLQVLK